MTRLQNAILYLAFIISGIILGLLLAKTAQAHVPLDLLADVHCMVETQHLPESEKDTAVSPKGAVGRCQIMPGTARWLSVKFKWDSEVDLTLREHSEALAHQRLMICSQGLRRRYGKAPQRSLSWCYLSGQVSLWTPRRGVGIYGYYLDEIERKLEWVRRNKTNWVDWKIIPKRSEG